MTRVAERAESLARDGAEIVVADLRDAATLAAAVAGCDAVIHCATGRPVRGDRRDTAHLVDDLGTQALVGAARDEGVQRMVYVSALGAGPDAPTESLRMKYRAEWHVLHSGLHFTILRPGGFAETWLGPLARRVAQGRVASVPGDASRPLSFVSAEDVARLCVLALTDRDLEDRTLDVGGPHPLTLEQALMAMERGAGRKVKRIHMSPSLMRIASGLVSFVDPGLANRLEFGWCVATHPHTCDSAGLQRMLPHWRPLPLDEFAEQFAQAQ